MLPQVRIESAGHGIDARFARALPVALRFDLSRPVEGVLDCLEFADHAFVLALTGKEPRGWSYHAEAGAERLRGAAGYVNCLGEQPDQQFTLGVLVPTYLDVAAADQPLVHRIAAVVNGTFLAYRRLTVPIRATPTARHASHILALTEIELAVPRMRSGPGGILLSVRERQCLSMAAGGLVTKQIAAEMGISEKTVELHLANARHKLGARTTTQAVAMVLIAAAVGEDLEA